MENDWENLSEIINFNATVQELPEVVYQANVIGQSMYSLGTTARRLIAMAMSLVNVDKKQYEVSFRIKDFLDALGLDSGAKSYSLLKSAIDECFDNSIEFNYPDGSWKKYTWFSFAGMEIGMGQDKDGNLNLENIITMEFNNRLSKIIKSFQRGYREIKLKNLGKLQGKYSIRFYELALSFAGFAGKNGNAPGTWFITPKPFPIAEIRKRFKVDDKKYKDTKNFRVKVIDQPIKEINEADIGLRIEPEYVYRGRRLYGVTLECRWVKVDEPLPVTPTTETDQENEKLREAFPEEFEKNKAEELAMLKQQPDLPGFLADRRDTVAEAEERTFERLREAHPDFLKTNRAVASRRKK